MGFCLIRVSRRNASVMANVHTFAWLPDEHEEFVEYLGRSPDVWARPDGGDPENPVLRPAPVAEYFARSRDLGERDAAVGVYLGSRAAVLAPPLSDAERVEGGTHVPFVQDGRVNPGVSTIVGGTKVRFRTVNFMTAELLDYRPGRLRESGELSQSNLCYYSSFFREEQYLTKSDAFLAWAKRVLGWVRRRTKASAPVARCNYSSACTARVAEAHAAGLVVTY